MLTLCLLRYLLSPDFSFLHVLHFAGPSMGSFNVDLSLLLFWKNPPMNSYRHIYLVLFSFMHDPNWHFMHTVLEHFFCLCMFCSIFMIACLLLIYAYFASVYSSFFHYYFVTFSWLPAPFLYYPLLFYCFSCSD